MLCEAGQVKQPGHSKHSTRLTDVSDWRTVRDTNTYDVSGAHARRIERGCTHAHLNGSSYLAIRPAVMGGG